MRKKRLLEKKLLSLTLCILSMLIITSAKNAEAFYNPISFPYSSWLAGPFYQPYFPPPPPIPPLFGFGYPLGLPPFGFGPQPLLSLLALAGLSSYFNTPNPGYPYSAGGYNFSTLFAGGDSPYPYASPFPEQTYPYLGPATATAPPTYNIYTSPLTSTLAPVPTTLAVISGITAGFGGAAI